VFELKAESSENGGDSNAKEIQNLQGMCVATTTFRSFQTLNTK